MAKRATPKAPEPIAVPPEHSPEWQQAVAAVEPQAVPGLADKPTYRLEEVAAYYDVTERTVRLWIEHGHLAVVYAPSGIRRVTRESLDLCRFRPRALRIGPF